ncbi:protein CcmA, bactofilin family [Tissierella praeacuta DSM 18095]|uniref:Protein CcmA, bactofilin family n=1 Tax=Tissierella praeacuta DSM 18095 TaxID=1123404 RepID=A0A1M4TE18_9FIRM|nr:polymer-forming cytoskeletal protein [Tissierella praeacuta]TCU68107.1 cytoskeletal protein CcmA (bactofilin family) [Tissierella praeacuta]SHE42720.1 protein CcmA, bactofilin family [Tissierella praeacuta DSM 18095]SUP04709.1 Predicted acyltransferase [Tissierella praeacuta]
MFRKKDEVIVEDLDSLIGENIKITGKIEGKGNLRVDGFIEGDIDYDGNIVIGESGKVYGNINANDISLAGTTHGNIDSKTKLVILPTGTLIGDIEVSSFIVHENAKFDGNCKMLNNNITELPLKDTTENSK